MKQYNYSPTIIGLAGGSGAGKSFLIEKIVNEIGTDQATVIQQDWYYKNWAHLPFSKRQDINFDEPQAFDSSLLIGHIKMLKQNKTIEAPVYDFTNHVRTEKSLMIEPSRYIFLEGILILAEKRVRDLFDLTIFIECDPELRFARRLKRDIEQRGRSRESVENQWKSSVMPMHGQYIEPSKTNSEFMIENNSGDSKNAVGQIMNIIHQCGQLWRNLI